MPRVTQQVRGRARTQRQGQPWLLSLVVVPRGGGAALLLSAHTQGCCVQLCNVRTSQSHLSLSVDGLARLYAPRISSAHGSYLLPPHHFMINLAFCRSQPHTGLPSITKAPAPLSLPTPKGTSSILSPCFLCWGTPDSPCLPSCHLLPPPWYPLKETALGACT